MQVKQLKLYGLVLVGSLSLMITAFGGGLFNQPMPWVGQWQHQAFFRLCHQIPDRSFWLNGQPMAVCSRYMGIYSGFALGWITLPLLGFTGQKFNWPMKNLAVVILLFNFLDAGGDFFDLWQNTLVSRAMLGSMLGISAALIFKGDFFIVNINKRELL